MTTTIAMPPAIQALPRNKANYPIPWFIDRDSDVGGQPDFRIADSRKLRDAIRFKLCWVCGQRRGVHASFIVGPMCAVNRTSAEPPAHRDCAIYSALACPFLSTPKMVRRDRHMPEDKIAPAGVMVPRNPGVALVWTSRTFKHYRVGKTEKVGDGLLFDMGDPEAMLWFAESRPARTEEILASIESGLPILREIAEEEGNGAVEELDRRVAWVKAGL